jgi:hypothetical protein
MVVDAAVADHGSSGTMCRICVLLVVGSMRRQHKTSGSRDWFGLGFDLATATKVGGGGRVVD